MKDQLREPSNFYTRAKRAKARISDALAANDVIGARSAAAAYGGVVKQWRRWLIEELTSVALDGVETSRAGVREWQTQMFGQSIASSRLKQYATAERSGGGRAGKITVPDEVERQVQAFYTKHKNAIKLV
ncbi:hypothetical protein [Massilia antarctica]|uniref:hypothetical protein n=1 Tax=Massilia antarctica TaxID=2765360 RepID=UPI0035E6361B